MLLKMNREINERELSMKGDYLKSLLLLFLFYLLSCASTKPPITEFSNEDSESEFIFFMSEFAGQGQFAIASIAYPVWDVIYDPSTKLASFLLKEKSFDESRLRSSVSPFGDYAIAVDPDVNFFDFDIHRNVNISVFDIDQQNYVLDLEINVVRPEFEGEPFTFQWSNLDDSFFFVQKDSLIKCFASGRQEKFLMTSGIDAFSISPSETMALVYQKDKVVLHDIISKDTTIVKDIGKTLGVNKKYVRGISWSADENVVAFGEGWRLHIYDIQNDSLAVYKAKGKIFETQWASDTSLVFVKGEYPDQLSMARRRRSFQIVKFDIQSGTMSVLHQQNGHSPFGVKPQVSPSGQFLLFSELSLRGRSEITVMSIDGKRMNKMMAGYRPIWRRQR